MAESIYSLIGKKIWLAGHGGMVGRALAARLESEDCEILACPRAQLDLTDRCAVLEWVHSHKPDAVFVAAAKVGGIAANMEMPAEFLHDNLAIAVNVIHASHLAGVEKLLFLGSSCIYPRDAAQPIEESALLTGALEPTNQYYAIAKIAGLMMCAAYRRQYGCNFISAMPCNLYGQYDRFDPETAHVIPALMRRFHEAKMSGTEAVEVWGSGMPRREFMHVDDAADALVFLMQNYEGESHVNIGWGEDISIAELAAAIASIVGFEGKLLFNTAKPDGVPRKVLDVSCITRLGWKPRIRLAGGLAETYRWFAEQGLSA